MIEYKNLPKYLRFDGSLTCRLILNKTDPIHEPFPPGTRVSAQNNGSLVWGNINNTPLPVSLILQSAASPSSNASDDTSISSDTSDPAPYAIIMDSGVTVEQTYGDLIKVGHDDDSTSKPPSVATSLEGIPHLLQKRSKVRMDYKGEFT